MDYKERLLIPIDGMDFDDITFLTPSGLEIAKGYERVVIGERGPYIEFHSDNIIKGSIRVPTDKMWKAHNPRVYYVEWRSRCKSFVKVYYQVKEVDYADYKIGRWYISPFDLTSDKYPELITKIERKVNEVRN